MGSGKNDTNPKLPDWVGWARREDDPRVRPASPEVSDFYTKLSRPPTRQVSTSLCCWIDLQGFSKLLKDSQCQPSDADWESLYERITEAHACCYRNLNLNQEIVLTLNDGIVRCHPGEQLSSLSELSMWFRDCVFTHNWINNREFYKQLPGARSVVSAGPQLRYSHPEFRFGDFVLNYTKPLGGSTSFPKDMADRPVVINPTQLQLNLAFSRAYILDQVGSKQGIDGPHFYLDQAVIDFLTKEAARAGNEVLDTTDETGRLFAVRMKNPDYFHLGFLLHSKSIPVSTKLFETTIWKVLAFCPWDEPQPFGIEVM